MLFQSYLLGHDVNKATVSLADKVRVHDSSQARRVVFEFLHLSPMKVIAVKLVIGTEEGKLRI